MVWLRRYEPLYYLDIEACEPYHHGEVDEVEHRVEHREPYGHALLHGGYLRRHGVTDGEGVVE